MTRRARQSSVGRVVITAALIAAIQPHVVSAAAQAPSGKTSEQMLRDLVGGGVLMPVPFPASLGTRLGADSVWRSNAQVNRWAAANAPDCPAPPMVDTTGWVPATNRGMPLPFRIPPEYAQRAQFGSLQVSGPWRGPTGSLTVSNSWAPVMYESGRLLACRFRGIGTTFLVEGRVFAAGFQLSATPANATGAPSTRISAIAPTPEQLGTFWTLLRTMRVPPFGAFESVAPSPARAFPQQTSGRTAEQIVLDLVGGGVPVPIPFPLTLPASPTELDSTRAQNSQPGRWVLENLPLCPTPVYEDTTGWIPAGGMGPPVSVSGATSATFTPAAIRLPPTYARVPVEPGLLHGASRWADSAGNSIGLEGGYRTPTFFTGRVIGCRFVGPKRTYYVQASAGPDGYGLSAHPADIVNGPGTTIWGRATTPERLSVLWTVILMASR